MPDDVHRRLKADEGPTLSPLGEACWLLTWQPERLAPDEVLRVARALWESAPTGVIELVPAASSLACHYDLARIDPVKVAAWLHDGARRPLPASLPGRHHVIPVCHAGACAPDLAEVAARAGLAPTEAIALLQASRCTVRHMGFLPGFPYLEGGPPALAVPRREHPRPRVPAGSIAVAAGMVGIYPVESPGGWSLIGRTHLRVFTPEASSPTLLQPGDTVSFVAMPPGACRHD